MEGEIEYQKKKNQSITAGITFFIVLSSHCIVKGENDLPTTNMYTHRHRARIYWLIFFISYSTDYTQRKCYMCKCACIQPKGESESEIEKDVWCDHFLIGQLFNFLSLRVAIDYQLKMPVLTSFNKKAKRKKMEKIPLSYWKITASDVDDDAFVWNNLF